MATLAGRLIHCRRGSLAVEFALILPIAVILVISAWHIVMLMVADSDLEAAARWASRFGLTTEASTGMTRDKAIEAIVVQYVGGWAQPETLKIEPKVYSSFANIGKPESFTDTNKNGQWDDGEQYDDVNKNGQWDADMGAAGAGGRGDIVVYSISFDGGPGLVALTTAWLPVPHFERKVVVQNE